MSNQYKFISELFVVVLFSINGMLQRTVSTDTIGLNRYVDVSFHIVFEEYSTISAVLKMNSMSF